MKKFLATIVCALAMLPAVSSASLLSTDTDYLTFKAASSSYTVNFSWTDGTFFGKESDGLYGFLFTDASSWSDSFFAGLLSTTGGLSRFNDVHGLTSGSFSQTFSGLTLGDTYAVGFGGAWLGSGGSVSISSVMAAVPEPETYAMLLAGLGLVGAMARRRNSRS